VVKRASLVVGLAVIAGCASIIDINTLEAPPPDAGADAISAEAGCSATGVTTLTHSPRGVHTALDDKDVYFTRADPPRDSAVLRCSKCGCERADELAKIGQPGGIAVDAQYVFFTDSQESGSLNRIDKSDPTTLQQIRGQEWPLGVTVDAEFVYWTVTGGGPKGVGTAGVYRARKSDLGQVTRLARSQSLPDDIIPYAIAVDDTYVYYTTAPDLNDTDPQQPCLSPDDAGAGAVYGTVRRVKKTGGLQTSEVVASGQACPVGLALDDGALYWANLGAGKSLNGSVWTQSKAGGSPARFASGLGRPTSLALFGGRLTWNVPASERIESCSLPACADIASLASTQRNPSGISADATGIYWAALGTVAENFSDGAIRRASAP
jgi:hypothetical protein